ncbi:MAG: TetR/AcrR family transcriptional regulator [Rhizobiaceae bacterium]
MPWEKNFDLDEATDDAIKVFWKKGYEGTSMADLIEGMGINKGSLYNAFGNKKALFDRAFLRYDQLNRQQALKALSELEDPVEAVATLFDGLIAETREDKENKGCLLVNTAVELPNQSDDVKTMVTSALVEFEEFFATTIRKGQKAGLIDSSINPDNTAKSLLALVVGLRVLARGTYDAEALSALKSEAVRLLVGK